MAPTHGGRHCASCKRTGMDLRNARASEALGLAMLHAEGDRACAHVRVDADGFVQLRPDRVRAASNRAAATAVALTAALAQAVGCASQSTEPAATPLNVPVPGSAEVPLTVKAECARPAETEPTAPAGEERRVIVTENGGMFIPLIRFEPNATDLDERGLTTIKSVASTMIDHPEIQLVNVVGHTDGTENYGPQLSMQRARVVVKALVGLGVAESRLNPMAASSSTPVAASDTPEGRAANRRITFAVVTR